MADGIKGTKSHKFISKEIAGIENSADNYKHVSVQELPGFRAGLDVVIHGSFKVGITKTITAVANARVLTITGHQALEGDIVRPITAGNTYVDEEFSIVKIVDANTVVISVPVNSSIIGASVEILRFVTPRYDENGNLFVNATPGPAQYVLNGTDTEVTEDTAVPANNRALPTQMFIRKNGNSVPVNKDTSTPANTVAVPVEIVAASGTNINITAGDINVQTTSEGSNFDSMRIGSGSGFYAEVTSNSDLSTFDSLSFTELVEINQQTMSIDTKTPALVGGKVPVDTGLVQGLTDTQLRASAVPVSFSGTQAISSVDLGLKADTPATDDTGAFSLIALTKRLLSKLPMLGTQTKANSQSVTLASDTNIVSTANSTSVALGSNGVFTGAVESVLQYSEIRITATANVASALNGLSIQQSVDGTNWDILDLYTLGANTPSTFGVGVSATFFRIVYTNGSTAQASFRLQVSYHAFATKPSSVRPQDGRINEIDAEEVVSYNSGWNGATWDRFKAGLVGPQTSNTGYQNVYAMGRYNLTPITMTTGQNAEIQYDVNGFMKVNVASFGATVVLPVSSTPLLTSTFATQQVVDTAVTTFTVPATAKRMVVYNNADALTANRIRRGNVAVAPNWSTSIGPILGVGSFTSELPATTFTCIAEDATSAANVSVEYFY